METFEQLRNLLQSPEGAAILAAAYKASGTTNAVIPPHGPNALFNYPGVSPGVVATIVTPTGIEDFLEQAGHVRMSQDTREIFAILTGQTASSGTEPTSGCNEDVPIPGDLKICRQTFPFGELTMKSKPIQVDRAGELLNRSEPLDLRLLNDPFAALPQPQPLTIGEVLRSTVAKALAELTLDIRRRHARLIWTGNPANTATNTGGYQEYNGFERVVNTGKTDVVSGVACPAADSYLYDFGNAIIQNNASLTMQTIREAFRHLSRLASDVGIDNVGWVFVMRYQLFLALVDIWACAYYSYRCYSAFPGGGAPSVEATGATIQLREAMLQGQFLLIDGQRVPVIIDNTATELNVGGGNFQSDVYLLPLTSPTFNDTGGQITYMEYFNYRGPYGMAAEVGRLGPDNEYGVSPDGRFAIFYLGGTAFCKQVMIRTRKRVVCRAPFLAARIQNLRYNVYVHEREWQPNTSFFQDGGATSWFGE